MNSCGSCAPAALAPVSTSFRFLCIRFLRHGRASRTTSARDPWRYMSACSHCPSTPVLPRRSFVLSRTQSAKLWLRQRRPGQSRQVLSSSSRAAGKGQHFMVRFFMRYRRWFIALCHAVIVIGAVASSFLLRFEFSIPKAEVHNLNHAIAAALLAKMPVFWVARFDRGWWRFASILDLYTILVGNVAASAVFAAGCYWMAPCFPRSIYIIDFLICFFTTAGIRFSVRLYYESVATDITAARE